MTLDLTSDDYFMGEALRQARLAFDTAKVPVISAAHLNRFADAL
jgi:hypothetical protein